MRSNPTNIPTPLSTDAEWTNWYDSLHSYFGASGAKEIWLTVWSKCASEDANTTTLRSYMKDKGIIVDTGMLGSIADTVSGIGDYIGDFFKLGKYAAYGVVGIILVALLAIVIGVARNPRGAVNTAAKAKLLL